MIFKRDLLEGLDELTTLVVKQGEDIRLLQHRVDELESKPEKRGRGRPRKAYVWTDEMTTCLGAQLASDILNKEIDKTKKALTKAKKSANVKDQPRDKSGKFAKK